jgi:hypothetical protein
MNEQHEVLIKIMNQFFEIQKKMVGKTESGSLQRNFERIQDYFGEIGLEMHNPAGESYNETRTDCEANIAGELGNKLIISEVIKPIVYFCDENNRKTIVQKGVVIVQSV